MAAAITSQLNIQPALESVSTETSRTENPYLAARREWDERYPESLTAR